MDRRTALPIAVIFITLVCVGGIYLSTRIPKSTPTTVIAGSAPPIAGPGGAGRVPLGPRVDEANGILTIDAGDAVDSNGVLFQVTSVVAPYNSSGPAGTKPRAGEFMVINVQIHNSLGAGGDALTISSASNFELQDANGKVYAEASVPGAPKPPDGRIGPGETLDGALAYDVPVGQGYRLLFKETLVSQGEIIVDLGRR